ncbi:hypothetical protein OE88DRAFT_1613123, partial [Heliocybe sulcata]
KRKPSRRANTAERRATHNAVERARRETLNGRFLVRFTFLPSCAPVRGEGFNVVVSGEVEILP